jgi:hypothetical protein
MIKVGAMRVYGDYKVVKRLLDLNFFKHLFKLYVFVI